MKKIVQFTLFLATIFILLFTLLHCNEDNPGSGSGTLLSRCVAACESCKEKDCQAGCECDDDLTNNAGCEKEATTVIECIEADKTCSRETVCFKETSDWSLCWDPYCTENPNAAECTCSGYGEES